MAASRPEGTPAHHCVLAAARAADGQPEALMDEVAGTVRQAVRL